VKTGGEVLTNLLYSWCLLPIQIAPICEHREAKDRPEVGIVTIHQLEIVWSC
jgi:hypothetical protein